MKFITTNGSEEVEIAKAVDLNNTINVSGAATLGSTLDVTGAVGVDGNFDVNTNKFTVAQSTGNTVVAGTFNAQGDADLDDTPADDDAADDAADAADDDEEEEALQERFKKLANIIKG